MSIRRYSNRRQHSSCATICCPLPNAGDWIISISCLLQSQRIGGPSLMCDGLTWPTKGRETPALPFGTVSIYRHRGSGVLWEVGRLSDVASAALRADRAIASATENDDRLQRVDDCHPSRPNGRTQAGCSRLFCASCA